MQSQVIEPQGLTYVGRKPYMGEDNCSLDGSTLMPSVSPGRTGEPCCQGNEHHQSFEPVTHQVELHPQASNLSYNSTVRRQG